MNERIVDDLVLKARAMAITDTEAGGKQFNLEVFHKKFAELIVKECCDVLYDNELGGYQVNYVLKEHFGVE